MILNSYRSWIHLNAFLDRCRCILNAEKNLIRDNTQISCGRFYEFRFVSCVVSIATSRLKKGYRRTSSASFFRFFFRTLYLYISEGMYFGPMEVAATTRWRRAFNLELMNESSRDWTAMSWAISGTSPWRMMHLDVCFHLVILFFHSVSFQRMSFNFSNMQSVS